jgi:hypothetical protein
MVVIATLVARRQSFAYWIGVLSVLMPGLLSGVWLLLWSSLVAWRQSP